MGIDARLPTLLLLVATFASALYFPQSNLTLRLPYPRHNGDDLSSDIVLLKVRTLRNDSTVPKDPKYQIVAPPEKFAYLDHKNGNVILHALPKGGAPIIITLQARERGREMASSEIQIQPVPVNERKINCSNYLQDICFWGTSKYRVYENKPVTMLGKMGPDIYRSLCPHFQITTYELLNGTDHFHIINNELFSNASLDRDTVGPPGGPGAHVEVLVKCVVWEETTGLQHRLEKILEIDILDENDNPPVSQTNGHLVIPLRDFMVGARLDRNDLIVKDADAVDSNRYTVHILGDVENALNITFDKMVVDLKQPPSTAVFIRIFSKLTLLPRSPYHVILQVTDETLLPGYGNKSTNISLTFDGPRHYTTTSTTVAPPKAPIAFPGAIKISRGSSQFTRVVQPLTKPTPDTRFSLHGSKALEITREDGIVYVSNTTLLESSGPTIPIKIEWRGPRRNVFSVSLVITVVDAPRSGVDQCNHSCANAAKSRQCEASCGVGSGVFQGDKFVDKCAWRDNARKTMTQYYGTCSPTLTYCPNFECDALERLDHRICPQDCIVEAEGHFVKINAEGRGIREGMDVCSCNDDMQCFCGPGAYQPTGSHKGGGKEGDKGKKDRDKDSLALPGARKAASSGPCGPTCLIGIIGASLFVLVVIIGTFGVWRFRMATKESRRECKHRREGGSNGLGILPSDYVDRGDGLLIGLDSLTTVNRTLLVPKTCPPDPKWEFPRSRLTIEQVLGEGEFGRVLRAKAVEIGGWQGPTTVAVKTLKEGACASELADLLSEYQLLKEAQHPNVIRLLGACTSPGGPVYLIIEFAEFGSLRNYLRRSRHLESEGTTPCTSSLLSASPCNVREDVQSVKSPSNYGITPRDILSFAWQISKGMAYLADIKLVHRDLAARNVLLATGKVCKISDFGLTRDVYEDDAYLKRSKGRVPVKWMAPESLADHVYTSKSDVWSFGILLWELVTLGASPYPGVDVHNLYNLLKAGYRMEKPANCSQQLYKLMVSCWHEEPGMRPSFKELTCQWERMLEDGVEYLDLNPRTVHNQAYFSSLHALDSPASKQFAQKKLGNLSHSGSDEVSYGNINIRTDAVNYCTKESSEPVTKCDRVDKLQALWQEPIASFPPEPLKPPYANDRVIDRNVNHYETPIKRRNSSVTNNEQSNLKTPPNERPQSYIDMEGKRPQEQENLLLFNSVDKRPDFDVLSNGLAM